VVYRIVAVRRPGSGIGLAPLPSSGRTMSMFAIAAILIGVIGIFYVRRRSARKKTAPAR
jgi:LPXTG-motif cell wall-anchored protein